MRSLFSVLLVAGLIAATVAFSIPKPGQVKDLFKDINAHIQDDIRQLQASSQETANKIKDIWQKSKDVKANIQKTNEIINDAIKGSGEKMLEHVKEDIQKISKLINPDPAVQN